MTNVRVLQYNKILYLLHNRRKTLLAHALEGYGGGDVTAACEKIRMEPYKRELQTGVPQKITCEDCNKILASLRNVITAEELEKFKEYRYFG